jgi:hypothetical protein
MVSLQFGLSAIAAFIAFGMAIKRSLQKVKKKKLYYFMGDSILPCCGVGLGVFAITYLALSGLT